MTNPLSVDVEAAYALFRRYKSGEKGALNELTAMLLPIADALAARTYLAFKGGPLAATMTLHDCKSTAQNGLFQVLTNTEYNPDFSAKQFLMRVRFAIKNELTSLQRKEYTDKKHTSRYAEKKHQVHKNVIIRRDPAETLKEWHAIKEELGYLLTPEQYQALSAAVEAAPREIRIKDLAIATGMKYSASN